MYVTFLLVAETGLEPMTFGLWAQRATTAPLRDIVCNHFVIASAKVGIFSYKTNLLQVFFNILGRTNLF